MIHYDSSDANQGRSYLHTIPANSYPELTQDTHAVLNGVVDRGCNCEASNLRFYNHYYTDDENYVMKVLVYDDPGTMNISPSNSHPPLEYIILIIHMPFLNQNDENEVYIGSNNEALGFSATKGIAAPLISFSSAL